MSKFIDQLVVGTATFILSIFLPKHFITLIRELIKFIFISLIRYWYITAFITGLIFFINYKTDCKYLDQFYSTTFLLVILISNITIVPVIALLIQLFKTFKPFNIAYYGCFSVKENEYLTIDLDSENLNERFEKLHQNIIANHYCYKNGLIKTNIVKIPKFISILIGSKGINKFIQKRIVSKKHIASIHFIRDINKQNLTAIINFDKANLVHTTPLDNAENLISNLSSDSNINNLKIIDISTKIYFLLFGQTMIDMMIDFKKFVEVHSILDDSEKLLSEILNISSDLADKHKSSILEFINYWKSYTERYRAIVLIEQNQFLGAIQHIMKSISLNPYYPYFDYVTLKQDFTKKYGIDLAPSINHAIKELDLELDESENDNVKQNLEQQVEFVKATFNYQIVKEILERENTEKIRNSLSEEFSKLDKTNPFILLTISEVIKYMEKGTEKYNEVYVARIDETINLLKDILKLDDDFPLIHTKIGLLTTMKGFHYDNEKMVEDGLKEYEKGMYFMSKLGFKQ